MSNFPKRKSAHELTQNRQKRQAAPNVAEGNTGGDMSHTGRVTGPRTGGSMQPRDPGSSTVPGAFGPTPKKPFPKGPAVEPDKPY